MKLVLGSSQFNVNYGILKNKLNLKEIIKIEKKIFKFKVNFIDTASSYLKSENLIGRTKLNNLEIITKIRLPKTLSKKDDIENWTQREVFKSLKKLRVKKIYGLLLHNQNDLKGRRGKFLIDSLKKIKKRGNVKNIGISLYSPDEILKYIKYFTPDIIQVPFNVLDTRLLEKNLLNFIKKKKIKVFIRSIFLQGLLLNEHKNLNINIKLKRKITYFKNWCKNNDISCLEACINFVKNFKQIDFAVIGFNSYEQLSQIVKLFYKKKIKVPNIFSSNDYKIIDPRNWS